MTVSQLQKGSQASALTSTTVALDQIRNDIICGQLAPGAKLKIELLQERYDVGATPLREALSLLCATGLVERFEQRGFRVARVSAEEYAEILWSRCTCEEQALRDSIQRGDKNWEERIVVTQYHLHKASEAMQGGEPESLRNWERWHSEFHAAIISACRSKYLVRFCAQLYDAGNRYRYLARLAPGFREGAYDEHKRISDAVLARDADLSVSLLIEHFRRTGDILRARFSDFDSAPAGKTP
jgi:GntR family transcriptional regulator, carbon starvation induced regulator